MILKEIAGAVVPIDPSGEELLVDAVDRDLEIAWLYAYDRMVYALRPPGAGDDGTAAPRATST